MKIYSTKTGRIKRRRSRPVGEMPRHLIEEFSKMTKQEVSSLVFKANMSLINNYGTHVCRRI